MRIAKRVRILGGAHRLRARTGRRVCLAIAAVAVMASGCLSSGYNYISHSSADNTHLFFKIPSKWKVYDYKQILESANGHLSNSQLSQIQGAQWIISFGSDPTLKPKQAGAFGKNFIEGAAFSEQIPPDQQDTFAMSTLRGVILGTDPAASGSGDTLLSYNPIVGTNGIRGSEMTVDLPGPNGKIITYGQVAMVDAATNYTYAMGLGCYASCWGPNEGLINQILKSWIVKAR